MKPIEPRIDLFVQRRCKRCKSRVTFGFDCYVCPHCGTLPAGLFVPDPTEPEKKAKP